MDLQQANLYKFRTRLVPSTSRMLFGVTSVPMSGLSRGVKARTVGTINSGSRSRQSNGFEWLLLLMSLRGKIVVRSLVNLNRNAWWVSFAGPHSERTRVGHHFHLPNC